VDSLRSLGYSHVSMCVRYVEERQCWPGPNILFSNPNRLTYLSEESPFYWEVSEERFRNLPKALVPTPSREVRISVLREFVGACRSLGVKAVAWVPLLRFDKAVREDPSLAAIDAWGSLGDYKRFFMCPSNPYVRSFIKVMIEDLITKYELDEVELDYVRYPKPPVTHAPPHASFSMLTCFCRYCREGMREEGIDPDAVINSLKRIGEWVRDLINKVPVFSYDTDYLSSTYYDLAWRVVRDSVISEWLEFRARRIAEVVSIVRDVIKTYSPKTELSADLYPPSSSWLLGQDYRLLAPYLRRVKLMMYTAPFNQSPARIPFEVSLARDLLPSSTDVVVGVAGWPPTTEADLRRDIGLATSSGADGAYLYSFGWCPKPLLRLFPKLLSGCVDRGA